MEILLWAIPVFVVTMLIERQLTHAPQFKGYWPKDSFTNLAMGVGNLVVMFGAKAVTLALYLVLYQFRIFEIPTDVWWCFPLLMLCDDFCYYWYHRSGHQVRLFWAAHVNHHSATSYNLSTALRQSWTSPLLGWIFWLPLPLLGFHPLMVMLAQAINLLYQYWIHTELIDKMGPFGKVFNTPSHHRVHHGTNPRYLDRNHGGILIVWDRLFGTFEPEQVRPDYGLTHNLGTYNLLVVAFHEWQAIARDVRAAGSWRGRFGYLFGPPGWREDGTGKTSRVLRREAIERELAEAPES